MESRCEGAKYVLYNAPMEITASDDQLSCGNCGVQKQRSS